jgi:CRP/FNR family transcriptional regulator, dissimilatory nitrate respiration regulator|tara:strand:- start:132 stop:710 length:579 start_codon:yes stop_codon:yes gene_type:complete
MIYSELQNILSSKTIHLKSGQYLFTQGDSVKNIYCVNKGRIKLVRDTFEGTPILIHVAYAEESIAEASLFSKKYHCSALAGTHTEVTVYSKNELLKVLQEKPQSMMNLLRQLTTQVRDLRMLNEIKSIYNAKEKVLTYLATEFHRDKESDLPLKDIAQKIGMAHETFYRTLKTLENDGKIERNKSQIKLTDL